MEDNKPKPERKPRPNKMERFIRDAEKRGAPHMGRRVEGSDSRMYVCCNIYIDITTSPWTLYDGNAPSVR